MALQVTAAQELASSKKSIALKPKDKAKIVLVKHYISPSCKKGNKLKPTFREADAPSKAYKRRSFEMTDFKEIDEQRASTKRRRSVQLGGIEGTLKTVVPLVQDADDQDTVLLPEDWLDKRYKEDLLNLDTLELDEHKSLFSMSEEKSPQVKSNAKCKSLFASYHLNKVHKSIIDEM